MTEKTARGTQNLPHDDECSDPDSPVRPEDMVGSAQVMRSNLKRYLLSLDQIAEQLIKSYKISLELDNDIISGSIKISLIEVAHSIRIYEVKLNKEELAPYIN